MDEGEDVVVVQLVEEALEVTGRRGRRLGEQGCQETKKKIKLFA